MGIVKFLDVCIENSSAVFNICVRVALSCFIMLVLSLGWILLEVMLYGEATTRSVDTIIAVVVSIIIAEGLVRCRKWKLRYNSILERKVELG